MKTKVGVIGLGNRGSYLLKTVLAVGTTEIVAVCDLYEDRITRAQDIIEECSSHRPRGYRNYKDLLADPEVECVCIFSSWESHIRLSVASMRAGKPTALEVGGAYDIEDCWQLVRAYEETETPFMLMENCCFDRFELTVSALARASKLGKLVYCHGAYGHDIRNEILGGNINRHYRLENYRRRNAENYPTHELGPIAKILDINRGNRFLTLTSVSTKGGVSLEEYAKTDDNPDPSEANSTFAQGDIVVTTITCAGGEVITLRLDTTLPRFYDREFTVRGTRGMATDTLRAVLLSDDPLCHRFDAREQVRDTVDNFEEYTPDFWKNITEEETNLGHGGMDYFQFKAFFTCLQEKRPMPVDVYDCAAWMAITPLSEQSIAMGGHPVAVPDFTRGEWMRRPPYDVADILENK